MADRTLYVASRVKWRRWLKANHKTSPGIWLVYYRKASGKARFIAPTD